MRERSGDGPRVEEARVTGRLASTASNTRAVVELPLQLVGGEARSVIASSSVDRHHRAGDLHHPRRGDGVPAGETPGRSSLILTLDNTWEVRTSLT